MSTPGSFTLCTTAADVLQSLVVLLNAEFLVLDCEGHELGGEGGALSLLTIGTHDFSKVFVYDAVQLDRASLQPVLSLLANPDVLKVVWDGRMDYSELYYSYGTRLEHVLDLQIVEVVSREIHGENDERRLSRLKGYFSLESVRNFKSQYVGLQALVGMQRCLQQHCLAIGGGKDVEVKRLHSANQSSFWMTRPLPHRLLAYAAKDVHLIHLIFDHFKQGGYLGSFPVLLAQSRRYVSMHVDVGSRPRREDCFRNSPILPLDILQEPAVETHKCAACHRQLSLHCYTARYGYQQRSATCRVCQVIGKRNNVTENEGWVSLV